MKKEVVIISTQGRGAWLAHQLQRKNCKTTLLDVGSLLPPLSSVEREGPFGVFLPSHLDGLQKQYLCGDDFHQAHQGFSIFTPRGPVECQGSLSSFFKETREDVQLCQLVLSDVFSPSVSSDFSVAKEVRKIKKYTSFKWLLKLSAELTNTYREQASLSKDIPETATVDISGNRGVSFSKKKRFSPFFSDYILRESSQRYFMDLKESLQEEGVEWTPASSVQEVELMVNEMKRHSSPDRFLIWTLSGTETAQYFPNSQLLLFPGWTPPIKIWKRFSLYWDQPADFEKIIPPLLLVLSNKMKTEELSIRQYFKNLHYRLEDLLSLKKHPMSSVTDLWVLCPYADRFNAPALFSCLQSALERLRILFPGFSIEGSVPEKDFCHNYFVLYEYKKSLFGKKLFYRQMHPHLLHLNPEAAGKLDAYSLMQLSHSYLQFIQE